MMNFRERQQKERKGGAKQAFSSSVFLDLLTHYVNDPELESHIIKVRNGEATKVATYPVKNFRKVLRGILIEFGVPKEEAETIMTGHEIKSKTIEGLYEFMSDFMYQYMKSGRKLRLVEKEDMVASIWSEEQEEQTKDYSITRKDPKTEEKTTIKSRVKTKAHSKLVVKTSCPNWLKEKENKEGKMEEVIRKLF